MSLISRMSSTLFNKSITSARWVFNCSVWNPSESEWLRVSSGIQEEEKVRIGNFVFKRDAKSSMAGRLLMRKFVVDSTGLDWNLVEIGRDNNNKPVLTCNDHPLVQFNVSHQGDYAVLAGEVNIDKVGIDVMKIEYTGGKSVSEFFRVMNRQFSSDEWSTITSQSNEMEQLKYFYRFWCLKESYVKAVGTGITVSLKEISFKLNSSLIYSPSNEFIHDTELFLHGVRQTNWVFEEILIDEDHCCAVALNVPRDKYAPGVAQRFHLLNFNELVKNLKSITPPDVSYCRQFLAKEEVPL